MTLESDEFMVCDITNIASWFISFSILFYLFYYLCLKSARHVRIFDAFP